MFGKNLHYSNGKKVEPFGLFIAPMVITFMSFPLIDKYPVPFSIVLVSLFATIILSSLSFLLTSPKANSYLKKHHSQLWAKRYSRSFRERWEARREIHSMILQVPQLEKLYKLANRIAFTLLSIWTLIFLMVYSLITCSFIWDWPFNSLS